MYTLMLNFYKGNTIKLTFSAGFLGVDLYTESSYIHLRSNHPKIIMVKLDQKRLQLLSIVMDTAFFKTVTNVVSGTSEFLPHHCYLFLCMLSIESIEKLIR